MYSSKLLLLLTLLLPSCGYSLTGIDHGVSVTVGRERGGWYNDRDGAREESGTWAVTTGVVMKYTR